MASDFQQINDYNFNIDSFVQGNNGAVLRFNVRRKGAIVPIDNATVNVAIKRGQDLITKNATIISAPGGICEVILTRADLATAGTYYLQPTIIFPDDDEFSGDVQKFTVSGKLAGTPTNPGNGGTNPVFTVRDSAINGNVIINGAETVVYDDTGKVDKVAGKGLSTNDYDNAEKAEVSKVKDKADKTYVDTGLLTKVDKVAGKGLSTNDYDNVEKAEVAKVKDKADKTYVDTQLADKAKQSDLTTTNANVAANTSAIATHTTQINANTTAITNIGNGSPKGTYATLTALQTAFPTGTTGVYVVTADGKWYYWSGSAWTAGGIYQSTGIVDGSVTSSKTSFITDIITSKNLFDKNTRTEGYYLVAATGATAANASYFYSDYIKVTPSTSYVGRWSNTIGIICYYDANKVYISGHGISADDMVFTTPANANYIRVSNTISRLPDFRINLGSTLFPYDEITVKYKFDKGLFNGFVYVAKDGSGDFSTVTQAVASVSSGTTIVVKPGIYDNEEVQAWGKTVHIIGVSKQDCIIQNSTGDYDHPPLEMSAGLLKNITVIANSYIGSTPPAIPAYALHVEDNYMQGKNLTIENCRLESYCNYALGMGMRGGCKVEIKNSDLVGKNNHGGLFFHDASNVNYAGMQTLRVIDTNIFANDGTPTVLRMDSQQTAGTTVNLEFIKCNVRNLATGAQDKIFSNVGGSWVNTIPELTNFNLSKGSWGNNLTLLNAF